MVDFSRGDKRIVPTFARPNVQMWRAEVDERKALQNAVSPGKSMH
jgi:hypothetical protein